jgi:hypothetical protein
VTRRHSASATACPTATRPAHTPAALPIRTARNGQRGALLRPLAWTAGILVVLAALLLAGVTWGPHLARDRIARAIGESIGRPVAIGRIEVAPFDGRLVVSDLVIGSHDGPPSLSLPKSVVSIDWRSLWRRSPLRVHSVRIDSPSVRVVRTGPARFDFSDIVDRFAAPSAPPEPPRDTRWRLERLEITGGTVAFDDRVVRKASRVEGFELTVDDLGNDPDSVAADTRLNTGFRLNGRPVQVEATATPLAPAPAVSARVRLDALPVTEVLPYLTLPPDVRPTAGTLTVDLRIAYRRDAADPAEALRIEGTASLAGPSVDDAAGRTRVAARALAVTVAPSMPLGGRVHLARLALEDPRVVLGRTVTGAIDWPARSDTAPNAPTAPNASTASTASPEASEASPSPASPPSQTVSASPTEPAEQAGAATAGTSAVVVPSPAGPGTTAAPATAVAPGPPADPVLPAAAPSPAAPLPPQRSPAKPTTSAGPRALRIDMATIEGGSFAWTDAALAAPLSLALEPLRLRAEAIEVPDLRRPGSVHGSIRAEATVDGAATLAVDATLDGTAGRARVTAAQIDLPRYAALVGPALKAQLEQGRLDARMTVDWDTAGARWSLAEGEAALTDLKVTYGERPPALLQTLALTGLAVDPSTRRVSIGAVTLADGSLAARRGRDGRVDLQDWYVPASTEPTAAAAPARSPAPAGAAGPAWDLRVAQATIDRLVFDYTDELIARDRKLPRVTVSAKASDLSLDLAQTVPYELTVALADGSRLASQGTVRPSPLGLDAKVRLQRFTLTHFDPYVSPFLNLSLASGQLWGNGQLRLASGAGGSMSRIGFDGEVSANDFRAIDKVSSNDFLRFTALALPSVKVDWRPDRPGDSLVEIGAVAFVDFYARIILTEEGRLNLGDILVDPERGTGPRSLTTATEAPRGETVDAPGSDADAPAASGPVAGGGELGDASPQAPAPARRSATRTARLPSKAAAPDQPRPTIRIGTVQIASGNIDFTDLFIRPNFTANLTQLVGSIEAIASDRTAPSAVAVTGSVDNDTPLEITGRINPLAPSRFIDLRAIARGFDLPKLSAYSGRWAGYAIERGKLTADLRYTIEGDRLKATNKVTINQLTFGDKVDSPDALNLPVRLAVSLLKDAKGNIDLDLPISGTISAPEFSVGGLLLRALGNLIVRVIASPFTLLASLAGGSEQELSHLTFAPGSAALDDEARRRLDALATALEQRPALSLDIAGYADPTADREAMQRERLEQSLRSAKLAQMKRAAPTAELPPLHEVSLDETERAVLLEHLWREAGLDAGAAKAPPPDELEARLLERTALATDDLRQVAQQRAQAARDHLRDRKGIANERLYLLAPRVSAAGDKQPPRRAEFAIK